MHNLPKIADELKRLDKQEPSTAGPLTKDGYEIARAILVLAERVDGLVFVLEHARDNSGAIRTRPMR